MLNGHAGADEAHWRQLLTYASLLMQRLPCSSSSSIARAGAATALTWQQLDELMLSCITHEDLAVRSLAVECVTLHSLLLPSPLTLRKAVLLLHGLFMRDCPAVAAAAAKGLADISMALGPGRFMEAVGATVGRTAAAAGFVCDCSAAGGSNQAKGGSSSGYQQEEDMEDGGAEGEAEARGGDAGNQEQQQGAEMDLGARGATAGDEEGYQGLGILELLLEKVSVLLVQAESEGEADGRQRGRGASRYAGWKGPESGFEASSCSLLGRLLTLVSLSHG